MARCDCCGCVVETDYGTSIVEGAGTSVDPYVVSMVDPEWVRPYARIWRTTAQSIPTGDTFTPIVFNAEIYDTNNFWVVGSPSIISINEPGIYIFGACGRWAANATGTRELAFRLDGTTIIQKNDSHPDTVSGGDNPQWQQLTYQYRLNTGQTLELLARQESGGALNLEAVSDASILFWIVYAGKVA